MSTYGVTSTNPLEDNTEEYEVIAQNFFISVWNDLTCGIAASEIDFGYEPNQEGRKRYTVKFEENFTDMNTPDLAGKYDAIDVIMDAKITERGGKMYKTSQFAGSGRGMIRRYIERVVKQNSRTGITTPGQRIKHLYNLGARNVPEPERQDLHSAIVTFRMQLFKVTTV